MSNQPSLVQIFGELPVDPDIFSTLDPAVKWLSKFKEGDHWCTSCGTLNPEIPRSHHHNCCSYMDADEFPEYKNPLGHCVKCESDYLRIESSREQQYSAIICGDCGYQFGAEVPEEDLADRYLKMQGEPNVCK